MKRAVLCSAHDWDSPIQVSAHHYARALIRAGWEVAFLGAPVTPAHALMGRRKPDLARRVRTARLGPVQVDGCWARTPFTIAPVFNVGVRSRRVIAGWHRGTLPGLVREMGQAGFDRPDLVVVDTPLYGFLLDELQPRRTVYRVTDYNPGFASATPALIEAERSLAARCDLVVHTADSLADYAVDIAGGAPVAAMPNGVDAVHFAGTHPEPEEFARIPHPRLIYVGSLKEWFDFAGVERLCRDNPDLHVVVVGPGAEGTFSPQDNLHVLGPRAYDAIPAYLQHADVGIIPFDRRTSPELIAHTNPLKLYEYLAAGLPVVATRWETLEALASPAVLVDSVEEMATACRAQAAHPSDGVDSRRRYAAAHAWDRRLGSVLGRLGLQDVPEDDRRSHDSMDSRRPTT